MADALVFVEQRPLAGRVVEVRAGLTFGREGCDVVLLDPEVSRRHARISMLDGAPAIADLGSTNGTWVNGHRIGATAQLAAGDVVRFGNTLFHVEFVGGPTRVAGAPRGETPTGLSSTDAGD
jgi:pSer/pThr/pTyr-binding forkhead associated (FHA) protein